MIIAGRIVGGGRILSSLLSNEDDDDEGDDTVQFIHANTDNNKSGEFSERYPIIVSSMTILLSLVEVLQFVVPTEEEEEEDLVFSLNGIQSISTNPVQFTEDWYSSTYVMGRTGLDLLKWIRIGFR